MRGWALKECVKVDCGAWCSLEGLLFCNSCFLVDTRGRAISPTSKQSLPVSSIAVLKQNPLHTHCIQQREERSTIWTHFRGRKTPFSLRFPAFFSFNHTAKRNVSVKV